MVKFTDLKSTMIRQTHGQPSGSKRQNGSESQPPYAGREVDDYPQPTCIGSAISEAAKGDIHEEERSNQLYDKALSYLATVFSAVRDQKDFNLDEGIEIIQDIVQLSELDDTLFLKALHAENGVDFLVQHSVNVSILSIFLAGKLGYNLDRRVEIGAVAMFHDIGTALISKDLVYKKDAVAQKDLANIRKRVNHSFDILQKYKEDYPYLAECSHQVYERIDGSGYPRGLQGDEIHEYAKLVGLVDFYEALIHDRPYRDRLVPFQAVKEIIKSGKKGYRKGHLKALLMHFSVFPLHSYVRLNSKSIGRVVETYPEQPLRPRLQILFDSQKRKVMTDRIINLPDNPLLFIVDSISEEELMEIVDASEFLSHPESQEDSFDDAGESWYGSSEEGWRVGAGTESNGQKTGRRSRRTDFWKVTVLVALALCLLVAFGFQLFPEHFPFGQGAPEIPNAIATQSFVERDLRPPTSNTAEAQATEETVSRKELTGNAVSTESIEGASEKGPAMLAVSQQVSPPPLLLERPAVGPKAPQDLETAARSYRTAYPYSIKLTYFKTQEEAETSLPAFRDLGLFPHWVKVNLGEEGIWHRVFTGYYTSLGEARTVINSKGLTGAVAKETEYATLIQSYDDEKRAMEALEEIRGIGFSPYLVKGKDNRFHVMVGAFYTRKGAEDQKQDLTEKGIDSRIVER